MARPKAYKLKDIYGDRNGTSIYYTGFASTPKLLPKNGRGFGGLKHILELLGGKFKKFTLTITPEQDSITKDKSLVKVRLSAKAIKRLTQRKFDSNRELSLRLGNQLLAEVFPTYFTFGAQVFTYQKGIFAEILNKSFDSRTLAPEDRAAITKIFTETSAQPSAALDIPTAYETAKDVQLLYLKQLVGDFDREIEIGHDESWWQTYFSKNILFFQSNYIKKIEKLNILVAGTQFPDFIVVTSDGYLDIIEIKKPATDLLKEDTSRGNFYWSSETAKAISQTENYIDNVVRFADAIRSKLRDDLGLDLQIIKPRGIVIAGKTSQFQGKPKKAGDFRRLNGGLKNVQIIPFDELSQQLKNTIVSIGKLDGGKKQKKRSTK